LHRVLTDAVKNGTLARNVAAIHAPPNVENEEIELGFTGWTPIWLNDSHFSTDLEVAASGVDGFWRT
jgi:hypothetical protein